MDHYVADDYDMINMEDFDIEDGVLKKYNGPGVDVEIPDGIKSIGPFAFYGCSSVTRVVIPKGVRSIGEKSFSDCRNLSSVMIPEGVTSIGKEAFRGCHSLSNVVLPKEAPSIGEGAFSGCRKLADSNGFVIFDGCPVLFGYYGPGGDVVIPEGVTRIDAYAITWNDRIISVTIPEGTTSIGTGAFSGCKGLKSITIPDSMTSIGEMAFQLCRSLTRVVVPEGVTNIGEWTFWGCSSLCVICYTPYVASSLCHIDKLHLIYMGDSFSELTNRARKKVVRGFFYAQENGITKINRWRQSYLEYIRAHVGAFIGDAKKNRFIRLFLMREGLLDVKGSELLLKFQLEKFRQGEDVGGPLKITITQCEE